MYRSLSTSRGAGNLFNHPRVKFSSIDAYSSLSTSRGAGNVWIRPCTMTASRIETYLPCEGPETHHKEKPSLFQQGIYSSLSTSRGAGNNSNNCYFGKSIFMYSYLSTSRGDGNMKSSPSFASNFFSIDTYLPREGPET